MKKKRNKCNSTTVSDKHITLTAEEEPESLLMRVKEESEKAT